MINKINQQKRKRKENKDERGCGNNYNETNKPEDWIQCKFRLVSLHENYIEFICHVCSCKKLDLNERNEVYRERQNKGQQNYKLFHFALI